MDVIDGTDERHWAAAAGWVGGGLTEDQDGGGGAASPGYDVAGLAAVVARVGESGLTDDQVVVSRQWPQRLLVLQPLHLEPVEGRGGG